MEKHRMEKKVLGTHARLAALLAAAALANGALLLTSSATADTAQTIQVYKTPTCGCCGQWIDHLREAGFEVEATDMPDLTAFKAMNGVPKRLTSCHTAMVEGYVIEGHVPAADITRLLTERPKIAGLAVPGMPMGSPGMEHPDPSRHEAFEVLAFGGAPGDGEGADEGGAKVFSTHTP
ncbi:MAG: hypothetical protein CL933_03305 [Deltaproteobacteria bacterium]|nr:hypothetical protein [Deltaproteobacteria bacterium]